MRLRAGQTALRSSTARPASIPQLARCYATNLEPSKPKGNEKLARSFQGQMLGSITTRLRREREQRSEYEKWRQITDPSRNWMISFSASQSRPPRHGLARMVY